MKHILKQAEPQEFIDWKAQENENWKPTYDNLQNPEKKIVKAALIQEQGGMPTDYRKKRTQALRQLERQLVRKGANDLASRPNLRGTLHVSL